MNESPFRPSVAAEMWQFVRLWARDPAGIGAVAPSGRRLADAMARAAESRPTGIVVELGGGTGRITAALVERAADPCNIVVIEREPSLCALLRRRFPQVRVLHGDARDIRQLIEDAGIDRVSNVVSGLPLLAMPRHVRGAIAAEIFALLGPEGSFVQFTYGPRSPVPRETVEQAGFAARRIGWVVRNLPPACVWAYRRAAASPDRARVRPAAMA